MSREALEAAAHDCLTALAGVETHDIDLRDHPQAWQAIEAFAAAAQADAFERAAKLCEDRYLVDTAASNAPTASDYVKIRHIAWAVGALNCATMIRVLAKESGK